MEKIYVILTYMLLFIIGLYTGRLSQKNVIYGVSIPSKYLDSNQVKQIKKSYVNLYLLIMGGISVVFIVLEMIKEDNPIYFMIYTFVWIIVTILLFILQHLKVKEYKKSLEYERVNKKRVISATLVNRKKENKGLFIYFAPGFMILIGLIIYTLLGFDEIPSKVPLKFDLEGNITRYGEKGLLSVFGLPIISFAMLILLSGISFLTLRFMKRKIDPRQPITSEKRIRIANKYFVIMMAVISLILQILFSIIHLAVIGKITMTQELAYLISFLPIGLIFLFLMVYFWKIGIQGDRLKLDTDEEVNEEIEEIDDDEGWYFGIFYANPKDQSLFVPKRAGGGYTFNFGRPLGWILLFAIITLVITLQLLF